MQRLNIGIDIDGTLTPWQFYIDQLNIYFGKNINPDEFVEYDDTRMFGITDEMMREFFEERAEEMHRTAPIRPLAAEVLLQWQKRHQLYLVTARRDWTHPITMQWMKDQGIKNIPLYTLGTAHKTPVALELSCDLFLEDHPRASVHLAQEGIKVLLMAAPYNRTCSHPNLQRIYQWDEAGEVLEKWIRDGAF